MSKANGSLSNGNGLADVPEDEVAPVVVRMRGGGRQPLTEQTNAATYDAVQRGIDALLEGETSEETEEIRKVNAQLDHLNDYMTKVEQRLKDHNEKLMETLAAQRREREKKRQSFHERLETNKVEDTDFSKQFSELMGRVNQMNMQRGNRQSVYDFIGDSK